MDIIPLDVEGLAAEVPARFEWFPPPGAQSAQIGTAVTHMRVWLADQTWEAVHGRVAPDLGAAFVAYCGALMNSGGLDRDDAIRHAVRAVELVTELARKDIDVRRLAAAVPAEFEWQDPPEPPTPVLVEWWCTRARTWLTEQTWEAAHGRGAPDLEPAYVTYVGTLIRFRGLSKTEAIELSSDLVEFVVHLVHTG